MKIWNLMRRLEARNGTAMVEPILTAGSEIIAKHFEQEELKFLQQIGACHIVADVPGKGAQLVMPVANLFMRLGIHRVFTVIQSDDVKESTVVALQKPSIIMPGSNGIRNKA